MQEIKVDSSFWRDDLDNREVMVSIKCTAYNHEAYIRDALEGFVNQKTNFRFEAIVHDDASTDGTAAIIREYAEKYPSIIKPIFETENQWSKRDGSLTRIINAHIRGKYVAFCEGDDYWIDSLKLQKQVDFLENNSEYGMIFGKVRYYDQKELKYGKIFGKKVDKESIFHENTVPTPTVLIKTQILFKYRSEISPQNWKMGDYPLWLFFSLKSEIFFMDDILAVYRVLPESASHTKNNLKKVTFALSFFEIKLFYLEKYTKRENLINQTKANILRFKIMLEILQNKKKKLNDLCNELYKISLTLDKVHKIRYILESKFPELATKVLIHQLK